MKTITTGTEITFTKTNDKFELIQTPAGFDVKPIKLSKSISTEPYLFQELLDLYESGKITIDGFEEADAALIRSILTNYIHTTEIEGLKADIAKLNGEKEALVASNLQLTSANSDLTTAKAELTDANQALSYTNKELSEEINALNKTVSELNAELVAMDDEK